MPDYKKMQDRLNENEQVQLYFVKQKKLIDVWPVDAVVLLKQGSAVWPEDVPKKKVAKTEKQELEDYAKEKFGVDLDLRKSLANLQAEVEQFEHETSDDQQQDE